MVRSTDIVYLSQSSPHIFDQRDWMWVSHPFYILLTVHEPSRGTEILLNKDSSFIFLLCSWFLTKPLFFWSFYQLSNAQGILPLVQASAGAILASQCLVYLSFTTHCTGLALTKRVRLLSKRLSIDCDRYAISAERTME